MVCPVLTTVAELQPLAVSKLLAKVVEIEKPELVILGKQVNISLSVALKLIFSQAIDDDSNAVPQMLAAQLDWAQVLLDILESSTDL